MSQPILVFDMDGVLVDVSESYRETIVRTVEHFTGAPIERARIQEYKNQGGWNDDWRLTHHLVSSAGVDVPFERVKDRFQQLFLGNGSDGLMLRERWIARPGLLERLSKRFRLAVFTGRPRSEAELTLQRFAPDLSFDPLIAMEDVENRKPAPDGLLRIAARNPGRKLSYIGDTVDDARSARKAQIPFIGIAGPSKPLYLDLVFLLQAEQARAIIDDINYLEEVL